MQTPLTHTRYNCIRRPESEPVWSFYKGNTDQRIKATNQDVHIYVYVYFKVSINANPEPIPRKKLHPLKKLPKHSD